jgi:hypothetical protein
MSKTSKTAGKGKPAVATTPKGKGKLPIARPVPTVDGGRKFTPSPEKNGRVMAPTAVWQNGVPLDYAIRTDQGGEYDWAGSPVGTGQAAVNAILAKGPAEGMSRGEIGTRVAALKIKGRNGEPYNNVGAAVRYLLHRQLAVHTGGKWVLTPLARKRIATAKK